MATNVKGHAATTRREEIEPLLELAASDDPADRRGALTELCTCRVKSDDDRIWPALIELLSDEDVKVRRAALHAVTDSTPASRVDDVAAALESRFHDPDVKFRRRIRKTLAHFRRTGVLTDSPR